MRVNVVVDDTLMADAMRAAGVSTTREAVELGLRTLLRLRKQKDIQSLRGAVSWIGHLDGMRADR